MPKPKSEVAKCRIGCAVEQATTAQLKRQLRDEKTVWIKNLIYAELQRRKQ